MTGEERSRQARWQHTREVHRLKALAGDLPVGVVFDPARRHFLVQWFGAEAFAGRYQVAHAYIAGLRAGTEALRGYWRPATPEETVRVILRILGGLTLLALLALFLLLVVGLGLLALMLHHPPDERR